MTDTQRKRPTRIAGPYTSGEVPLPFTIKFDETDISFTGFTVEATLEESDLTEMAFAGSVSWDDIDIGRVQVDLGAADVALAAGEVHRTRNLMIWAKDGTNVVATLLVKLPCDRSVGTAPAP